MDDLESKLGQLLSDPEAMGKIMSLAQTLSPPAQECSVEKDQSAERAQETTGVFPDLDINLLQRISGAAKQSAIDKNEMSLLRALRPYLSHDRIRKLERAMRAAKMAKLATTLISTNGTGR